MKRIFSIIGILVLACGLLMGNATSAFAQEAQPQTIYGTVAENGVSIGEDGAGTITLEGVQEPIGVDSSTRYHVLGSWQTWQADLVEPYDRIAALISDNSASQVMVIPTHTLHEHLVGVVVEVSPTTITIVDREGNEVTIDKGTARRDVAEGDYATIMAKRMPEAPPRAMACRNLEQLVERLRLHLENAQSEEAFERVNALLDKSHSRHIAALEQIKNKLQEKAPEKSEAIARIDEAHCRSQERYEAAHARAEEMRAQLQQWLSQWTSAEGLVDSVDAAARTVSITLEGQEEPLTVRITRSTRIVKDGRYAFLRDVAEGDIVEKLVYSTETLKAATLLLSSPQAGKGTVEFRVTDPPPPDMEHIWVTISTLSIHKAGGGWTDIDIEGGAFDLKAIEGIEEFLTSQVVDAGRYTQIRLTVDSVRVITRVNGASEEEHMATVPGEKIKIVRSFVVEDGGTTVITVDFNGKESVIVTGRGDYIFKPVIKLQVAKGVPAIAITSTTLPDGVVGTAYNATLEVTGGTEPYTWSISEGSLPEGLTLDSAGVISGTPTTEGDYSFTVKVVDSSTPMQSDTQPLSITISGEV